MIAGARPRCTAFTIVELLVAMAIITILAGVLAVVAVRSVQKARATWCLNNIRQLALANLGVITAKDLDRIQHCPAGPPGPNYGQNRHLGDPHKANDPGRTVFLYESKGALVGDESDVDQRHMGGSNYVFCDGHAKWMREIPSFRLQ